jgi:hypothetical protein
MKNIKFERKPLEMASTRGFLPRVGNSKKKILKIGVRISDKYKIIFQSKNSQPIVPKIFLMKKMLKII